MNQKNSLGLNSCFMDLNDPFELFKSWMAEAEKKEIRDPTASSLATTNNAGQPDVRMVLLKGLSSKGFVFYTNLNSPKSHDLKENPKAAMCFYWKSLSRQIIVIGSIAQVEDNVADKYYNSRDYESRIGAWASNQSETLRSRNDLLKKINEYKQKYPKTNNLPRPKHWSGWNLTPSSIEFWLHAPNRIHERLKYKKANNEWQKVLLNP